MRHTPLSSCLQVPAEEGQPYSVWRSIPELEATYYSHVCFDIFIPTGSAQLASPLVWITSAPGSPPITDPIYLYMVHPWPHHLAARPPWCSTPQGKLILVCCRHPWSCHPGPSLKWKTSSHEDEMCHHSHATWHKPPHPAHVSTTAAAAKPATAPKAAKSIRSTDDLMKEFLVWFTDIGRFPGKYKIWFCHNAQPMIHAPRKWPIALCLKVKEHPNRWNAWAWSPV